MSERRNAFQKIETLLNTKELASLGPKPRESREPLKSLEEKLTAIFSEINISQSTQPLVLSLVLLWHDYLDESHSISQNIHSSDGSFLHGIMHRREPDYGNAKYWFHRVGEHPSYSAIAGKVGEILNGPEFLKLKSKLIHKDLWDPFAFVDACADALRKNDGESAERNSAARCETISVLQRIQEIEFKTLLEHFLR